MLIILEHGTKSASHHRLDASTGWAVNRSGLRAVAISDAPTHLADIRDILVREMVAEMDAEIMRSLRAEMRRVDNT